MSAQHLPRSNPGPPETRIRTCQLDLGARGLTATRRGSETTLKPHSRELMVLRRGAKRPAAKGRRRKCAGPPQSTTALERSFPQLVSAKKRRGAPGSNATRGKCRGRPLSTTALERCVFQLVSAEKVARETGLEPAASAVTGRRSNQLSYSRNSLFRRPGRPETQKRSVEIRVRGRQVKRREKAPQWGSRPSIARALTAPARSSPRSRST
jgi:hypothetical protein